MNRSVVAIAAAASMFLAVASVSADAPARGAFAKQKLSADDMADLLGSLPTKSATQRAETDPVILNALGALRWGMASQEVIDTLVREGKGKLDAAKLRKAYVTFDGQATEWEASAVGKQYTHGNGEAMLVVDQDGVRTHLFFIQDKLWKRFETVAKGERTTNFHRFARTLRARFGAGHVHGDEADRWIEFGSKRTRVRGLDGGEDATRYGVVFEDRAVLDKLGTLRVATVEPVRIAPVAPVKVVETKPARAKVAARIAKADKKAAKAALPSAKVEEAAAAAKKIVKPPVTGELDAMASVDDDDPLTGL